jgi:septal ring factor EnvC (AmiA/AmiB activator)
MSNAKLVDRMFSACNHTVPIVVPCRDCVAKMLDAWDKSTRQECASEAVNRYKEINMESARVLGDIERARQGNADLAIKLATVNSDNNALRAALKAARRDIDNLNIQLKAESTNRTFQNIKPQKMAVE